jgi:hypothetical protein
VLTEVISVQYENRRKGRAAFRHQDLRVHTAKSVGIHITIMLEIVDPSPNLPKPAILCEGTLVLRDL